LDIKEGACVNNRKDSESLKRGRRKGQEKDSKISRPEKDKKTQ